MHYKLPGCNSRCNYLRNDCRHNFHCCCYVTYTFYYKGVRLRRQKQAELNKEKEERWFSLRKEYQGAILRILGPKETSNKGIDNQKKRNAESGEWEGRSKEDYINELRDSIKWIEKHWVDKRKNNI